MTTGLPTASMQTSAPWPSVTPCTACDRIGGAGVDGVGGAESLGRVELPGVEVDGNDRGGARQTGTGDGGAPHATATEHGDGVTEAHLAGEHGGAQAGGHPAAQEADRLGAGARIDLGALPGRHQRLVGERADAQGRGEGGAVGQCHLLAGVVRGEAVPGPTAATGPALTAHRPPVQDDEVAGRDASQRPCPRLRRCPPPHARAGTGTRR